MSANDFKPHEDKIILQRVNEGVRYVDIAQELGRNPIAVSKRYGRLTDGSADKVKSTTGRIKRWLGGRNPYSVTHHEAAEALSLTTGQAKGGLFRIRAAYTNEEPVRPTFNAAYMPEAIKRAKARADAMIKAGTAPSAAVQQVYRETDILLNVDDLAMRPAGEAASRLLDRMEVYKCTA